MSVKILDLLDSIKGLQKSTPGKALADKKYNLAAGRISPIAKKTPNPFSERNSALTKPMALATGQKNASGPNKIPGTSF